MTLFRWTRVPADRALVCVDERVPWPQTIALGTQYLVVMLGATVAPLLMGFDPNLAMLMCGISTLLFYLITAGQVPSFLGCSSTFIGAVVAVSGHAGSGPNAKLGAVLGGVIAAGMFACMLGLLVRGFGARWILHLLPPVVNGTILLVIGANLAMIPAHMLEGASTFDASMQLGTTATLALLMTAPFRRMRRMAVMIALAAGTGLYAAFANGFSIGTPVTLHTWQQAAWFGLPVLHAPQFHFSTMATLVPLALVLAVETLSHVKAVGDMTGRDLHGQMGNALIGDGLGTMLSGGCGGPPLTSYAENIGIMAATRVYSSAVLVMAGVLATGLGLSPRVGELLRLIPTPILGGVVIVVFGMIAVAGIRMLIEHAIDLQRPRNQLIVAIPLVLGAGHFTFPLGNAPLDGIAIASFAAILLQALLPGRRP